ncbi:MAG: RluA family pseudouridine synthase [Patescibacteria group bacterium]
MDNPIIPVIYEDENILAVNKPAGLLVHGVINNKEKTLVDWLLKKYPEVKNVGDAPEIRPGIVHRLDKDTSGVILICRNQNFFKYAKNLFQEHKIKKKYLALTYGEIKPKSGIIEKPIAIKSNTIKRTVWEGKNEKTAITEYKVLKYFKNFSLVEVSPKTGRTHQIRVHLASIGHPIVGDSLYGPKENPLRLKRQFLHAESLEFSLENGQRIKIEAELPDDLRNVIEKLNEEE